MDELDKILRAKFKGMIPEFTIVGKVTKVDEENYTCNVMPLDNDAELFKVRLKPAVDNDKKGVISIPTTGSYVLVGMISKTEASFIVRCSNIEKYYIIGDGGNALEFKNDGTILINGDIHDGLVKIAPLVSKINALETLVNNILSVLKTTTIPLAPSGTYPFAPLYSALNDITPITSKNELENTKVKHGAGN